MRDRIRRLSWQVELAIVLVLAFGWTLRSTLRALLTPAVMAHRSTPPISNIGVWSTILLELILLGLLVPFLRVRGWTLARLGIQPSLRGCLQGVGLAIASYGLYIGLALLVANLWPEVGRALVETRLVGEGTLSWTAIVVASIINPFYEEIFVCGYVITVLTERRAEAVMAPATEAAEGGVESVGMDVAGAASPVRMQGGAASPATAINISAGIRLSYHLYQGVAGVLSLVPTGLLFGFWFARTRRLWPLIVAHAVIDFVGLSAGAR